MPYQWMLILLAVVLGWIVQLVVAYRQSMSFTADARALRRSGTVSIGVGGRRYRGGRAFVGLAAVDGVVRDAIVLSGFTTFARSKALPQLVGLRVNLVAGDREIEGLSKAKREAARQAAGFFRQTPEQAAREVRV